MKKKKKKKVKVRKSWGDLDPATKVIPDKKNNYNRAKNKQDLKKELDQQDWFDDEF
jgi:hypothetical protein